jgi:hypothetical protein
MRVRGKGGVEKEMRAERQVRESAGLRLACFSVSRADSCGNFATGFHRTRQRSTRQDMSINVTRNRMKTNIGVPADPAGKRRSDQDRRIRNDRRKKKQMTGEGMRGERGIRLRQGSGGSGEAESCLGNERRREIPRREEKHFARSE